MYFISKNCWILRYIYIVVNIDFCYKLFIYLKNIFVFFISFNFNYKSVLNKKYKNLFFFSKLFKKFQDNFYIYSDFIILKKQKKFYLKKRKENIYFFFKVFLSSNNFLFEIYLNFFFFKIIILMLKYKQYLNLLFLNKTFKFYVYDIYSQNIDLKNSLDLINYYLFKIHLINIIFIYNILYLKSNNINFFFIILYFSFFLFFFFFNSLKLYKFNFFFKII